jgi:hypothetical protein
MSNNKTTTTFNLRKNEIAITVKTFAEGGDMNQPYAAGGIALLTKLGKARLLGNDPNPKGKGKTSKIYAIDTNTWEKIKVEKKEKEEEMEEVEEVDAE